jgi:hypothetical protein
VLNLVYKKLLQDHSRTRKDSANDNHYQAVIGILGDTEIIADQLSAAKTNTGEYAIHNGDVIFNELARFDY